MNSLEHRPSRLKSSARSVSIKEPLVRNAMVPFATPPHKNFQDEFWALAEVAIETSGKEDQTPEKIEKIWEPLITRMIEIRRQVSEVYPALDDEVVLFFGRLVGDLNAHTFMRGMDEYGRAKLTTPTSSTPFCDSMKYFMQRMLTEGLIKPIIPKPI